MAVTYSCYHDYWQDAATSRTAAQHTGGRHMHHDGTAERHTSGNRLLMSCLLATHSLHKQQHIALASNSTPLMTQLLAACCECRSTGNTLVAAAHRRYHDFWQPPIEVLSNTLVAGTRIMSYNTTTGNTLLDTLPHVTLSRSAPNKSDRRFDSFISLHHTTTRNYYSIAMHVQWKQSRHTEGDTWA